MKAKYEIPEQSDALVAQVHELLNNFLRATFVEVAWLDIPRQTLLLTSVQVTRYPKKEYTLTCITQDGQIIHWVEPDQITQIFNPVTWPQGE